MPYAIYYDNNIIFISDYVLEYSINRHFYIPTMFCIINYLMLKCILK